MADELWSAGIAAAGLGVYIGSSRAYIAAERRKPTPSDQSGLSAHPAEALGKLVGMIAVVYGLHRAGAPKLANVVGLSILGREILLRPLERAVVGLRMPEDRSPPAPPPTCPEGTVWEDSSGACVPIMEQHLPWPAGSRTGLSWEEMEEATPDLRAAKHAAQAVWHGWADMPGPVQWGYKFGMAIPLPGDQ